MFVGEAVSGSDQNRAHINVILGARGGPLGAAFANAFACGSETQRPFMVVVKPGVLARPITAFIGKQPYATPAHAGLAYGAAQMGLAKALVEAARDGLLPPEAAQDWLVLAAVLVPEAADDADAVFLNNFAAMRGALANALAQRPSLSECLEALQDLGNRYYRPGAAVLAAADSLTTPAETSASTASGA